MSHWDSLWSKRKSEPIFISEKTDPIYLILNRFNLMSVRRPETIVEFGCGQGLRTTIFAKRTGATPIYVDSSPEALELAIQNHKQWFSGPADTAPITFLNDVLHYKGPKGTLVWSAGLNEHFFGEDRKKIFEAMRNASKEYVLVIVPNAWNIPYRLTKFYRERRGTWPFGAEQPFSIRELEKRMEEAGLDVLSSEGVGALLSPYRWFWLGSSTATKLLKKPTPFDWLNRKLISKDLDFNSKINKYFGREIYVLGRIKK